MEIFIFLSLYLFMGGMTAAMLEQDLKDDAFSMKETAMFILIWPGVWGALLIDLLRS